MNPIRTATPCLVNTCCNVTFTSTSGFPKWHLPSVVQTNILCEMLIFSMRPTCPAYLTVHDMITKIIYDKEYELWGCQITVIGDHTLKRLLMCVILLGQLSGNKVGYTCRTLGKNEKFLPFVFLSRGSNEPWPAEQPPLAVFPDCTRRYWVDMWSAHRIPQLHFQLSKPIPDRYFFIQVTTQIIRSQGWVDPVPDPTPSEKF
jgi:hypothetical protein